MPKVEPQDFARYLVRLAPDHDTRLATLSRVYRRRVADTFRELIDRAFLSLTEEEIRQADLLIVKPARKIPKKISR